MMSFALFRDAAQDGPPKSYMAMFGQRQQTAEGEFLLVERLVCRECGKETLASAALRLCRRCERKHQ